MDKSIEWVDTLLLHVNGALVLTRILGAPLEVRACFHEVKLELESALGRLLDGGRLNTRELRFFLELDHLFRHEN